MKGIADSALCAAMKRRRSCRSASTLVNAFGRTDRRSNNENHSSTELSHDALVGVK